MWQYTSHSLEETRPGGKIIIRVYMEEDGIPECFFLEYNELPEAAIIEEHAAKQIDIKNQSESINQQ